MMLDGILSMGIFLMKMLNQLFSTTIQFPLEWKETKTHMQSYKILNEELIKILDSWMEVFLSKDRSEFNDDRYIKKHSGYPKNRITPEIACGEEYLKYMQAKPKGLPPAGVDGFPEDTKGCDFMQTPPPQYATALQKLETDLLAFFGGKHNAVTMYYPKGGYMSWHHNANASGLNILLSWSKDGSGFFRYQDPITKEIITMQDAPGWTAKAGYYGRLDEPDKIYWHCASAHNEERITLGYIVPHQGLWESMIESITENF